MGKIEENNPRFFAVLHRPPVIMYRKARWKIYPNPTSTGMKALPAIFAFLVANMALPSFAEQLTVSNFEEICSRSDSGSKQACQYYILGVTEGVTEAANLVGDKPHFCIPEDVSLTNVEALIKKAIDDDLKIHPADRDLAAIDFVLEAAHKAYPCRGAK